MPQPSEAKTYYGPRKIGQEAFEKQQAEKVMASREATVYGPRKGNPTADLETESEPESEPETEPEVETDSTETEPEVELADAADSDESGYVTIDELTSALAGDPSLLDTAIEAEFGRDDGPRKGAARVLLETELEREDGPREEVVARLEEHI